MSLSLSAGYTINIVTRPSVRPPVRPLTPSVAGSSCACFSAFACIDCIPVPIMYSVRDFVFDKYKSTVVRRAVRRACRAPFRKTTGIAQHRGRHGRGDERTIGFDTRDFVEFSRHYSDAKIVPVYCRCRLIKLMFLSLLNQSDRKDCIT